MQTLVRRATMDPTPNRKTAPIPLDECGLSAAADIVGDRWILLIIREVFYGVTRFDDIRADLGIPRSVLSQRLARLIDDGMLVRVAYQQEGQRKRFEYQLTRKCADFLLPIAALWQWAEAHLDRKPSGLQLRQRSTGAELRVGLAPVSARIPADDVAVSFAAPDAHPPAAD